MLEDTPFDFVVLGWYIGCFNVGDYDTEEADNELEQHDNYDADNTFAKLDKMGFRFVQKASRAGVDFDDKELLLDFIDFELSSRSLDAPIARTDPGNQFLDLTPKDFIQLGFEVGLLRGDFPYETRSRSALYTQLYRMGLSDISSTLRFGEDQITRTKDIIDLIRKDFISHGLQISFSSPEALLASVRDIMSLMTPDVVQSLPASAGDCLSEAEKCIVSGAYDAAGVELGKAGEFAYKDMYCELMHVDIVDGKDWEKLEKELFELVETTRPQHNYLFFVLFFLKSFRIQVRNKNIHVYKDHGPLKIRRLLFLTVEALTRISEAICHSRG